MKDSILELAVRQLTEAGFSASTAYPGQKMPEITAPAAAVHLYKVDSGSQAVTVEVLILSPAGLGGAECEMAARKAAAALQAAKAVCVQTGCQFDGAAQVYSVSLLATFSGDTGEASHRLGPGFDIYVNDVHQSWAVAFSAELVRELTPEYATRSSEAVAITPGSVCWNIRLEELFPPGFPETEAPSGEFTLKVVREGKARVYGPCRWASVSRSFGPEGLRRVQQGIALGEEEA